MKSINIVYFILIMQLTFYGCATVSNRQKTLLTMFGAGVAAGTAGAILAPKDEKPLGHATLWGGIASSIAAVVGLFIFDENARSEELKRQNNSMQKELAAFRDEGTSSKEPLLLYETSAPFGKEIPIEYSSLVKPGSWRVYKLNQWITQGEGTIVHQDRLVKLVPPQLVPANSVDLSADKGPLKKENGNSN